MHGLVELIGDSIMTNFWLQKKILVTGGAGFVGSHVVDRLIQTRNVQKSQIRISSFSKEDLRKAKNALQVTQGIDVVLHLAADVGGIGYSSSHQATQLSNCLAIDLNMFQAAAKAGVNRFVCVSSAVAYPVCAPSPLKEEDLFIGKPAGGGYGFGFAKRMSTVLASAYQEEFGLQSSVLLAANSYGPRQDASLSAGHVIPSLIRKCMTQPMLEVWGDGSQVRDFLYVEDFAEAILIAAEHLKTAEPINIGSGQSASIKELVSIITRLTNFKGSVIFDTTKPQGQKRRVLDITKAKRLMKFRPVYDVEKGLTKTVAWYKKYGKFDK